MEVEESGPEMCLTYKGPVRPSRLLYQPRSEGHGPLMSHPTLPGGSQANLSVSSVPQVLRLPHTFAQVVFRRRDKILGSLGLVAQASKPSYSRGGVMKTTDSRLARTT